MSYKRVNFEVATTKIKSSLKVFLNKRQGVVGGWGLVVKTQTPTDRIRDN